MNEHSLKYDAVSAMKKLRKAGASQGQAEAHVEVISGALENVATKSDLEQVEISLTAKTDQGNKLLLQQMEFMKDEMKSMNSGINQQITFVKDEMKSMNNGINQQITSVKDEMKSMNSGFNQQMTSVKDEMKSMDNGFNQRMDSMKDEFNQKLEKNFYKLLAFLPPAILTVIAVWEFAKDKLS